MALPSIASIALRSVPGAFILNSGIGKLAMDEGTAGYLHAEAVKGIPALANIESQQFGELVALGEIAVGGALLLPVVPNRLAGLALGGFSAGMLSIYFRDPEKTEEDGAPPLRRRDRSGQGLLDGRDRSRAHRRSRRLRGEEDQEEDEEVKNRRNGGT